MKYLKKVCKYTIELFSPRAIIKYSYQQFIRYKWLYLIGVIVCIVPCARMFDITWLNPFDHMDFIGDTELLKVNINPGDTIGKYASILFGVCLPIGQSLALLVWLIRLSEVSLRSDLTPEHLILEFIKISLFMIVLGKSWSILLELFKLFDGSISVLEASLGKFTVSQYKNEIHLDFAGLKDVRLLDFIAFLLEFGAIWVVRMLSKVITTVQMWVRKIKLVFFAGVAPLGCFDFIGGYHSTSVRYLKNLLALGIQGLIMYALAFICDAVILSELKNGGLPSGDFYQLYREQKILFGQILIGIVPAVMVMVALFNKSEEISKTMTGA